MNIVERGRLKKDCLIKYDNTVLIYKLFPEQQIDLFIHWKDYISNVLIFASPSLEVESKRFISISNRYVEGS